MGREVKKEVSKKEFIIRTADQFAVEKTEYLWKPYLPIGDYTVLMAPGGTGKSILSCGVAAAITRGQKLHGMDATPEPADVLLISAEDTGSMYRQRLTASGADLARVHILDCQDSIGLKFLDGSFEQCIKTTKAKLVVVDPWHAYCGEDCDINRVNSVRPIFQQIANIAKECGCAIILISHVNKRAQGENANNAAIGSVDFINASRSAIKVISDDTDKSSRIMVHTKSNYAAAGDSLTYSIVDGGGLEWTGVSSIDRNVLEEAAAKHKKPSEIVKSQQTEVAYMEPLKDALLEMYDDGRVNIAYQEIKDLYGDDIFGWNPRPSQAIRAIATELLDNGITYVIKPVKYKCRTVNGIQLISIRDKQAS